MTVHSFTTDILFELSQPTTRVPLHLSPDGRYLLVSVQHQKRQSKSTGHKSYTDTGIPRPMVNSRVLLVDTTTGVVDEPFPEGASWGAQWSPDGSAIAAYVQQGQEQACLSIWTRETRQSRRYSHVLVRPFFGFEVPRWTPDGQSVVVKLVASPPLTSRECINTTTDDTHVTVFFLHPWQHINRGDHAPRMG
ncbi:hypothetical protein KSC_001080 [Ktedonobacter sp. SOSP1-52]|uniref:hypothetical protein n=1 Tax=Ktedonobacter sp. SOSP1-52 TaxID=2778366 RepID=UPI0019150474|nr:hypothetical protein [Ktedonobacter sp. SOSP1-52]GHO61216.1 hypothetical protein KSC_001080 [Ktedonobacter sp. SOSP1-52]